MASYAEKWRFLVLQELLSFMQKNCCSHVQELLLQLQKNSCHLYERTVAFYEGEPLLLLLENGWYSNTGW